MTGYMQDAARDMKENEELRKEIGRLRDALASVRDSWKRPESGLTDFGEREHFANIVRTNIGIAKEALK